jgi:NADH-quinone oxidoreductase subunit G
MVKIDGRMVPACQNRVQAKMNVLSQSDAEVRGARRQMLEFTLLNHPVDCVICDKAGECALQRQYMDWDGKPSAVHHAKVDKQKRVDVGHRIILDQERCVLCGRCIRFCAEVAKAPELVFGGRGDHEYVTTAPGARLNNPYSINTVDICPVGALTDKDFRFKVRVWELHARESACTGCSEGCTMEIHHHRGQIYRTVPPKKWDINLNWMCDYGRDRYRDVRKDRLTSALVNGHVVDVDTAAQRIGDEARRDRGESAAKWGVVFGADLTNEDAFAAAQFAFELLEGCQVYLADLPDDGRGDEILRTNDPNPNRAGVRACAQGKLRDRDQLGADLQTGKLRKLYVLGDQLQVADQMIARLRTLDFVALQSSRATNPLVGLAHVVLPASAWAEVDGTVTNHRGQVKRLRPALEPPGTARGHWDLLRRVALAMGTDAPRASAQQHFEAMREHIPMFALASFGMEKPSVALRFAGRRG